MFCQTCAEAEEVRLFGRLQSRLELFESTFPFDSIRANKKRFTSKYNVIALGD